MKSKTTVKFWDCYKALPADVKKKAKEVYTLFLNDPWYPSIHFKRVHSSLPIYSVRITKDYRAVGILENAKIIWFWVGSHSDYDKLLKQVNND
ncbi:MAG: hypothetical protein PVH88_17765 [Ignavibacteria bacterium]|jgi:hypothetical protein